MAQKTTDTGRRVTARQLVGGVSAEFAGMSDEITRKLPLSAALSLCCSFVFPVAALRSIALPVKAILI
ncbi:hypothetical protein ACLMAJ_01700 [Nocardia sp. KC 131]|uniref:hypothetical protein n=1 Tax=Nocardia arseniciresistens TaxID=3392119 RepID=UPI00398F2AB5